MITATMKRMGGSNPLFPCLGTSDSKPNPPNLRDPRILMGRKFTLGRKAASFIYKIKAASYQTHPDPC